MTPRSKYNSIIDLNKASRIKLHGKKGIRVITLAESFNKKIFDKSVLVGTLVRGLYFVEDLFYTFVTLMGFDSTERVIEVIKKLMRADVHLILLSGTIISLYNIIDLKEVYNTVNMPLIAISYRESEGLENILKDLPMSETRLKIFKKNGERSKIRLKNGFEVFIRCYGLNLNEAKSILDKITIHGKIPEPIKITKNIARGILRSIISEQKGEKFG